MRLARLLLATVMLVSCQSAAPASTPASDPTAIPGAATTEVAASTPTSTVRPPEPTESIGGPDDYEPGPIEFRVANLRRTVEGDAHPVDIYVRTQGLVQAFLIREELDYGEVTDFFAPPEPGTVVLTVAGTGDPTCVGDCPHFVATSSTNFGEGPRRTIVLHEEGAMELWEQPDPDSVGSMSNALVPADPTQALLLVVAVALHEADFGLRLAFEGQAGCQANRSQDNVLVGGNQITVFGFDEPSVSATLHENSDNDCSGEPVGGPFELSGAPGSRTLLLLHGEPGGMNAEVLALE